MSQSGTSSSLLTIRTLFVHCPSSTSIRVQVLVLGVLQYSEFLVQILEYEYLIYLRFLKGTTVRTLRYDSFTLSSVVGLEGPAIQVPWES